MQLKGRLKIEFEEWCIKTLHFCRYWIEEAGVEWEDVPLSARFAILCQFLMETKKIDSFGIGYNVTEKVETVMIWQYPNVLPFIAETKDAAIEKAIEYLNDNYDAL